MKGVMTLWSAPGLIHRWEAAPYFWALSLVTNRRHFDRVVVHTDPQGARLLEKWRLPFDEVLVDLTTSHPIPRYAWKCSSLAKTVTLLLQKEPFCHFDADLFMWNDLPPEVKDAPVFVQSSEDFNLMGVHAHGKGYNLGMFDTCVPKRPWWVKTVPGLQPCYNTGIFGGTDLAFIHNYAEAVLKMVDDNPAIALGTGGVLTIHLEQHVLGLAARAQGKKLAKLLPDYWTDRDPRRLGFTHLLGGAKYDPKTVAKVKARLEKDHPELYRQMTRLEP